MVNLVQKQLKCSERKQTEANEDGALLEFLRQIYNWRL